MARKKPNQNDATAPTAATAVAGGEASAEAKTKNKKTKENKKKKASSDVRHISASKIVYTAATGTEYQIDVEKMCQKNLLKGTLRAIVYKPVLGDSSAWYYDATWGDARKGQPKLVRYPIDICRALESMARNLGSAALTDGANEGTSEGLQVTDEELDRYFQEPLRPTSSCSSSSTSSSSSPPSRDDDRVDGLEAPMPTTGPSDQNGLGTSVESVTNPPISGTGLRETTETEFQVQPPSPSAPSNLGRRLEIEASTEVGRDRLFSRLADTHWSSPGLFATATRWLVERGFRPDGSHCRKAAFCANLQVLKILLLDGEADVRGLTLLQDGKRGSRNQANGDEGGAGSGGSGWVQRSKWPIKVLLARGAILGGTSSSTSKLLRRLEEDGDMLWAQRVLDGLSTLMPDFLLHRIGDFLGLPPPAA